MDCWVLLVGFGLGLLLLVRVLAGVEDRRAREERQAQAEAAWQAAQANMALTCRRCRALARPIPGTGNRYRCGICGNQFAAARHRQ